MNCKSAQAYLSAYLDGELSGQESLSIREHLGECVECREEEQQLRSLKQMLRGLPLNAPSESFEDRLVQQVIARTESRPSRIFVWNWRLAGGLVAASLVVGLGIMKITERRVPSANAQPMVHLDSADFEFSRDQQFMAGNDPLSGSRFVVPTAYGRK